MIAPAKLKTVKNILVVRLDNLGDVAMTTPAFRALAESLPQAKLTLLTSPSGAALAELIPEVSDVIVFDAPWVKSTRANHSASQLQHLIDQLKKRRFELAVIFTNFSQSALPAALTCFLAEIPDRVGYAHEKTWQLLNHTIPDPEPDQLQRHGVKRQLDLVAELGCQTKNEHLSLAIPPGTSQRVQQILTEANVKLEHPWLVMHPGTHPVRQRYRYPAAGWIRVARQLHDRLGYQIVLTGTGAERGLVETIASELPEGVFTLADRLSLPEFAGLIGQASLLISNNSGPVHIAAALGTPVVDLYARTNPEHTPWMVQHRVLYFDPLPEDAVEDVDLSPEMVVAAAEELLTGKRLIRAGAMELTY